MIAQSLLQDESQDEDQQPMINAPSSKPFWGRDYYSLLEEEHVPDVCLRRINQNSSMQEVLLDEEKPPL